MKMSHIKKTVLLSVALPLMIGLSGAYAAPTALEDQAKASAITNKGDCVQHKFVWVEADTSKKMAAYCKHQ